MAEENIMRPMMAAVMIAIMGSMMVSLLAQAAPPAPTYCCPIHGRLGEPVCFYTYDDLATHFAIEHPSVPINIEWD